MQTEQTFCIDFIVRKTKYDKTQGYLIARITVNNIPTEISLNEKILTSSWSAKGESVRGKNREVEAINKYINDVRFRITESKRALENGRYEVSSEAVRQHYFNKHESQLPAVSGHTVHELVKKHEKIECDGKKLKGGTTKNYTTTEKYLKNFLQHYFKEADVDLIKINYEAILELESYIRSHPLKASDPCLGNGLYKHMERVEKMFGMAKDMRWIKENPFDLYEAKRQKVRRQNLKLPHFTAIENAVFSNPKVQFVRDLFVFDCYVGISYVDLFELDMSHFETIEGQLFCTIYRTKSDELCGIPVPAPALQIIEKYRETPAAVLRGKIFPYLSNQDFNRNLKIIAGILNIPLELDTRKARRFFAKEVNLKNGVPLETVSKLLGHAKISTTKENYADVDEEKIIDDTANVQERFNRKKQLTILSQSKN